MSLFCACAPSCFPLKNCVALSLAPLILLPLQLLRLWFFSCCAETLFVRAGVCARARVRVLCPWQQRVAASLRMVTHCGGA
jgi:hypothetical protein